MWSITTRDTLKQIPVEITGCPNCQNKTGTLYIIHVTNHIRFAGVLNLLKTHQCKAEVFCGSCSKYIENKYLSPEVQALAKEEKGKVKFSFLQRYGAWLALLAVILILRFVFKL